MSLEKRKSHEDEYTNSAAFKLSTLETLAADPVLKPSDLALFLSYTRFMKWPQRTAYVTNLKAQALTGCAESTISKSRARLIKTGYLHRLAEKPNGAVIYQLRNPRRDIIDDHIIFKEESLKEWDTERKAKDRARIANSSKTDVLKECSLHEKRWDTSSEINDNSF